MNRKTFLLALALTCTLLLSVGCGRRMNSATDGTDQNTTVEENNTNNTTTPGNQELNESDPYNNGTTNDNVVDGLVNGVEDTVDGVVNGVDDVVDGIDNTEDDLVNDTTTGTGAAANPVP